MCSVIRPVFRTGEKRRDNAKPMVTFHFGHVIPALTSLSPSFVLRFKFCWRGGRRWAKYAVQGRQGRSTVGTGNDVAQYLARGFANSAPKASGAAEAEPICRASNENM